MKIVTLVVVLLVGAQTANAQPAMASNTPQVRIRYMVNDVTASVDFYTNNLGFKLDGQSGPYFAALSRSGVQLLISPIKGLGGASRAMPNGDKPVPGGWNRMVHNTPDLPGDLHRLRKAGVHFRSNVIYGLGGNEAILDDPSGNAVELFQPTYAFGKK